MLENLRSSGAFIVFVVCASIFTDTFMYGLLLPILPYALDERVKVDPNQLQFWNTTLLASWATAILTGSIVFGWLVNKGMSKKGAFILGQVFLVGAAVLFMVSTNVVLLVVARILQGLCGGTISTLGYTLTFDAVGKDQIGVAIGYVTMSLSIGVFFGPIVGGALYDAAGYVYVFVPLLILSGITILLRLVVIEPMPKTKDKTGIASEQQPLLDEDATETGTPFSSSIVPPLRPRSSSLGEPIEIFTKNARGSPIPILLSNRRFVIAMLALFILNNALAALDATLPVFTLERMRFTSTQTALLFLCETWPQFLAPLAGWVVDRAGPKRITAFGFILLGASLLLMQLTAIDNNARLPILVAILMAIGFSMTLLWGPLIAEVILAVEELERKTPGVFGEHGALSLALGLQNAAFGAGSMIGPVYAGAILVKAGWAVMLLVLGVVSLLTAIPVFIYTGGNAFEAQETPVPDTALPEQE